MSSIKIVNFGLQFQGNREAGFNIDCAWNPKSMEVG